MCSGVFDGLHAGHVGYLQAARGFDRSQSLVVAVADDDYVRDVKQRDPRYPLADRMKVVSALAGVSWVTSHGRAGAAEVIRDHRPALFVKGRDWFGRLPEDVLSACVEVGAAMVFVRSGSDVHTSDGLPSLV